MKALNGIYSILLIPFLIGCVETVPEKVSFDNYSEEDQERLITYNGLWGGRGTYTTVAHGYTTCPTGEIPILFFVENGAVENMFPHEFCRFTTNIGPEGNIKFKYKDVGRMETDYAGTETISFTFKGKLSETSGKGGFYFGSCPGRWEVRKEEITRGEAREVVRLIEEEMGRR